MDMLNIQTISITTEILALISTIDEFKGAWRAFGTISPERLGVAHAFPWSIHALILMSSRSESIGTQKSLSTGYLQFTGRDSKRLQMSLNYSTRKTNHD